MKEITIDTSKEEKFLHYWEMCVGSCHAYTALRADYREQLKRVHEELGFSYIRFHGIFNDDMSVCLKPPSLNQDAELVFNFSNIDNIIDYLLEIGMKPFFELGDMPSALASEGRECFNYHMHVSPPKDYKQWNKLIRLFILHLQERYGAKEVQNWYFEVWNEPNNLIFWSGTKEQYFELYENTVNTIKQCDVELRVGGPSTSCNMWITEFIQYCEERGLPIDFISTHHYPADEYLWRKGEFTFEEVLKILMSGQKREFEKDIMYKMALKAAKDSRDYPLIYTEWNTSAQLGDSIHDESYSAAMVAKILFENRGLVAGYSYWTFSDIFEENGQRPGPYHGGFGLLNYYGIPKPVYRCMELLKDTDDISYGVLADDLGNIGVYALKRNNGMKIIAYNYNVPDSPMENEKVHVKVPERYKNAHMYISRIDHTHTNPKKAWISMGRPEYLQKNQIDTLEKESQLIREALIHEDENIIFDLPPYGLVAIDIEL